MCVCVCFERKGKRLNLTRQANRQANKLCSTTTLTATSLIKATHHWQCSLDDVNGKVNEANILLLPPPDLCVCVSVCLSVCLAVCLAGWLAHGFGAHGTNPIRRLDTHTHTDSVDVEVWICKAIIMAALASLARLGASDVRCCVGDYVTDKPIERT